MPYDHNNAFARILRREAPCTKVGETEAVLAFMDLMPQSDGHVLVIPKEPAMEIFELSDTAAEACMRMVRRVALAVRSALRPDGVVIAQLNGRAAGQTVGHVHFHVIPGGPASGFDRMRASWPSKPRSNHSPSAFALI
jgi:histidine triad (HIT) family protein